MYTIKRAAELTGISADTLRMWERRYGVVSPTRSDGNYRLYDDHALRTLSSMAALVNAGWSPSQAARRVLARDVGGLEEAPVRTASLGDPEALVSVAVDFDIQAMGKVLDDAFASAEFEDLVDAWLMPALQQLGFAWRDGRVTVAEEHFVSAGVIRRLSALFDRTPDPEDGPRVLVGLGPGSRHELGILAFAIAARRAGARVVYLGADVPADAWLTSVRAESTAAVVLAVPSMDDIAAARDVVDALHEHAPEVPVLIGGNQQHQVRDHVELLGHDIVPAARRIASLAPVG